MSLAGRDLINMSDLSAQEIDALMESAAAMAEAIGLDDPETRQSAERLDRIMATAFFEPSTRTRLSFESAMLRLGGGVLGFADPAGSSVSKGESLADTARTLSGYADVLVIRHPKMGAAKVAADAATIPVINAGDGAHSHPTQTLTDLFCIMRTKGHFDGLTVGLMGDLRYGRTVHSLGPALSRLGSRIICISPETLSMPQRHLSQIEDTAAEPPVSVNAIDEVLDELDVLYATRVQIERFSEEQQANAREIAADFVINAALMDRAPEDMILMHPLPRVDEIDPEIDDDPRAVYFEQAHGGVAVRMALVAHLLGLIEQPRDGFRGFATPQERPEEGAPGRARTNAGAGEAKEVPAPADVDCRNVHCISNEERFVSSFFKRLSGGRLACGYCEEPVEEAQT